MYFFSLNNFFFARCWWNIWNRPDWQFKSDVPAIPSVANNQPLLIISFSLLYGIWLFIDRPIIRRALTSIRLLICSTNPNCLHLHRCPKPLSITFVTQILTLFHHHHHHHHHHLLLHPKHHQLTQTTFNYITPTVNLPPSQQSLFHHLLPHQLCLNNSLSVWFLHQTWLLINPNSSTPVDRLFLCTVSQQSRDMASNWPPSTSKTLFSQSQSRRINIFHCSHK